MPAIVRQTLRTTLAKELLEAVLSDASDYYIGIGKSDVFGTDDTVPAPIDSAAEEREFRHNLQSIKKVEGSVMVTKRINWTAGNKYQGWDDKYGPTSSPHPFYVMNDAKEVYLCLSHGIDDNGDHQPSTIRPNFADHAPKNLSLSPAEPMQWMPFKTSDNYVWKFMFMLTPENIYKFLSSNHIPVQPTEDTLAGGDSIEDLQWHVRDRAIGGQIISVEVLDGGDGYDSANPPTVTIEGDGYGCIAEAVVKDGKVVRVDMTNPSDYTVDTVANYGTGYSHATVVFSGSGGATARAVITSESGLGADFASDFKTSSVLMTIKPNGDENGRFILENSFRQIGIIKNPKKPDGTPYTSAGDKCLSALTLNITSPFENGKIIESQSGARAYVNESIDKVVFYHQNESTGFGDFSSQDQVTQVDNSLKTANVAGVTVKYGIDRYTGEVLYIENHPRIRRDAEQQEDIKVVITV